MPSIHETYLSTKEATKCFHGLSLSCSSWAIRISTESNPHALSQSQIALVRERCVNQLWCIALILVGILKRSINHGHNGTVVWAKVVPETNAHMVTLLVLILKNNRHGANRSKQLVLVVSLFSILVQFRNSS